MNRRLLLTKLRREQRQADQDLHRAHDELATRVRQCTAELTRANEALQAETNERKRLEQELSTLSIGIEQSPVSIVITDREGNIEYVNRKFTQLTGYTSAEVIGQNPRILKSGKTPAEVHRQLWKTILAGGEWHGEFCNKKKNGELYWEFASISPVAGGDGSITHFIALKEDLTVRRQMEVERARHVRLTSLGAEIGTALGLNQDLRHSLQLCSELLVQYLNVAFFRIWTLNEAEQVLELQASAGMYTHIDGPHGRVPVGMFKIGMIASERLPHLTNDVLNDPRVGDKDWARRENMIAFAGYPLISGGRLMGVMATFARTPLSGKILDELGTFAGWIAQCIERKRVEEEVRFKNTILSTQQEVSPDGILVVAASGDVISYNHRFTEMWDIPPELVETQDDARLLQFIAANRPVDPDGFMSPVIHLYTHREERSHDEITLKDGKVFERYSAPMTGLDGKHYGRLWNFRDITARKRIEIELQKAKDAAEKSAQQLELVVDGANDATWEWDMVADQGVLNHRYYELTEYTPGEVVANYAFFIKTIYQDDVPQVDKQVKEYLAGRTGMYSAHYRMVTKSGRIRHVMGRGKIVQRDAEGRPIKMAGVVTDVTEHKRLSDEVNRIHNLESIGLLAGGLAHDFNNLLSIICGNISFAKTLAGESAALAESLTDAEEACELAKKISNHLQALSKGGLPMKEPITLADFIRKIAVALFKGSHITYSISAADDLLPVEGDPRQIRQVIENVLTNAKEAMADDGTVEIVLENCKADYKVELPLGSGSHVSIVFKDDGKGILAENLPKIFDPYFSTKDTYTQKGMGLGLSICHAILRRHKGHILVKSELGAGTMVTIYLPAAVDEESHIH